MNQSTHISTPAQVPTRAPEYDRLQTRLNRVYNQLASARASLDEAIRYLEGAEDDSIRLLMLENTRLSKAHLPDLREAIAKASCQTALREVLEIRDIVVALREVVR